MLIVSYLLKVGLLMGERYDFDVIRLILGDEIGVNIIL